MAEEKSAPKKAPKKEAAPAAAGAETKAPAAEKPAKAKAPAGDKPAKKEGSEGAAPAAAAAPANAPAADKPVELVGGVAKQPTAEDLLKEELGAIKVRKAKGSKNVTSGVANILASFNNTIVSITDQKGQVIAWSSAGKCNFRGSRKSTAYAAQVVAQDAARNAMAHGLKDVVIRVSGPGLGRDSAIRALQAIGLEITSIVDVTPIPHNGCRPRKRRRV
ncbi:30S ribosomal protein S11 [Opitutaceae bacterium EW11]|nr:30S ribosomal protein S11 [Opitutaceae bacterium EW11]